jgi:hypothetical protein
LHGNDLRRCKSSLTTEGLLLLPSQTRRNSREKEGWCTDFGPPQRAEMAVLAPRSEL